MTKLNEFKPKNILIIGAGVVGFSTGKGFCQKGHNVEFLDISEKRVDELKQLGFNSHIDKSFVERSPDVIFLTINTPSTPDGIKLDYLLSALPVAASFIVPERTDQVIINRSTVLPGTTDTLIKDGLEKIIGKKEGSGWYLAYNPEFLRAVSCEEDFLYPWATVFGVSSLEHEGHRVLSSLYDRFSGEKFVCSISEAEMIKYISNYKKAVQISFSNELWNLGKKIGLDMNNCLEIASKSSELVWNPLYGSHGGAAFGGTCLPKDTLALLKFAEKDRIKMPLLEATIEINKKIESLSQRGLAEKTKIKGAKWKASPYANKKIA